MLSLTLVSSDTTHQKQQISQIWASHKYTIYLGSQLLQLGFGETKYFAVRIGAGICDKFHSPSFTLFWLHTVTIKSGSGSNRYRAKGLYYTVYLA